MKSRNVGDAVLLRFEREEEVISALTSFVIDNDIAAGICSDIGAAKKLTLEYFDLESKSYRKKTMPATLAVVSLHGNVFCPDGRPFIHAHISAADELHRLYGEHLFSADVAVTPEMYLKAIPVRMGRPFDAELGW